MLSALLLWYFEYLLCAFPLLTGWMLHGLLPSGPQALMHRGEKEVEMKWVKWNRCHNKQEGKEERQEEGNKMKKNALNLKVGGRGIYRKTEKERQN